jgi:hypothetical protein
MYKDVEIYLAGYSTQQWKKSTQFNTTVTQAKHSSRVVFNQVQGFACVSI